MSVSTNCFDNIIGITKSECDCFGDLSGYSLSNLYVDGLVELEEVFGANKCSESTEISTMINKSLDEAKMEFLADFNSNMLTHFKIKRQRFTGAIGRPTYKTVANINYGHYAGVRMYCADVVSGTLKINKIGTIFSADGEIELHVKDNLNNYYGSLTLDTSANKHHVSSIAGIELPMHSPYIDNLEYYFFYETNIQNRPKANEVKCGTCGGFRPHYNTLRPYYNTQTGGQYGWANWAMVGGLYQKNTASAEDIDMTCLPTSTSNILYGLTFDIEFNCTANKVICDSGFDFERDPVALSIANAIRYRTGAIILEKTLRSTMINRFTMMNREEKKEVVDKYNEKYLMLMNYIITNLDFKQNDCFSCREKFDGGVTGIRA